MQLVTQKRDSRLFGYTEGGAVPASLFLSLGDFSQIPAKGASWGMHSRDVMRWHNRRVNRFPFWTLHKCKARRHEERWYSVPWIVERHTLLQQISGKWCSLVKYSCFTTVYKDYTSSNETINSWYVLDDEASVALLMKLPLSLFSFLHLLLVLILWRNFLWALMLSHAQSQCGLDLWTEGQNKSECENTRLKSIKTRRIFELWQTEWKMKQDFCSEGKHVFVNWEKINLIVILQNQAAVSEEEIHQT